MHGTPKARRTLLRLAGLGAAAGLIPAACGSDGDSGRSPAPGGATRRATYRPEFHLSVPQEWMNDPQRPLYLDGRYLHYYLYNGDYRDDGNGTEWRLATTRDGVVFHDEGVAVPKFTNGNGDVWSGSAVVDTHGTAGFGEGAVVALVTQQDHRRKNPEHQQAQFLWYSADGGRTFRPYGDEPVLPNPGAADFRDPKVVRDEERGRWVMLLAEGEKIGLYVSGDLRGWRYVSGFVRHGIGLLECPDLFRLRASDGRTRWVLGAGANGRAAGLPHTYAYWTGDFDGETFHPDGDEPQWLDHGFDWYAAVTWEKHGEDGSVDPEVRRAQAWMNNWEYPDATPTTGADGFNGAMSVVREVTLQRRESGEYALLSRPVPALDAHASRTRRFGTRAVDGERELPFTGQAYDLRTELALDGSVTNAGLRLRTSGDGTRHLDVGVHGDYAYVSRADTRSPAGKPGAAEKKDSLESRTPVDPAARRVRLRVLVDRTSVELFVDDGRFVHTHAVFPEPGDTGVTLFAEGGRAHFGDMEIRTFGT